LRSGEEQVISSSPIFIPENVMRHTLSLKGASFLILLACTMNTEAQAAPSQILGLGQDVFEAPFYPVSVSALGRTVTAASPYAVIQQDLTTGERSELPLPADCISLSVTAVTPDASQAFGICLTPEGNRGFLTSSKGARFLSERYPSASPSACTFDGGRCLGLGASSGASEIPLEWTGGTDFSIAAAPSGVIASITGLSYDGNVATGTTIKGEAFQLNSEGLAILAIEAEAVGISGDGRYSILALRESFLLERAYRAGRSFELLPLDSDFALGRSTRANALSSDGSVVVGAYGFPRGPGKAFIWTEFEGFSDLVAYTHARPRSPIARWRLESATALSGDASVVAGYGVNPQGLPEGWVLFLGDWCGAAFNEDGTLSPQAISSFYPNWEAGLYSADTNRDGGVDGSDVECFWSRAGAVG
jgi:hypothetical protein